MTLFTNPSQPRRGVAMPEGAMALGALVLVLFGAVDLIRAVHAYRVLDDASRETARWASAHGSGSGEEISADQVREYAYRRLAGVSDAGTSVAVEWDGRQKPGSFVTVTINQSFDPVTPFIPRGTWSLQGLSRMAISP